MTNTLGDAHFAVVTAVLARARAGLVGGGLGATVGPERPPITRAPHQRIMGGGGERIYQQQQ